MSTIPCSSSPPPRWRRAPFKATHPPSSQSRSIHPRLVTRPFLSVAHAFHPHDAWPRSGSGPASVVRAGVDGLRIALAHTKCRRSAPALRPRDGRSRSVLAKRSAGGCALAQQSRAHRADALPRDGFVAPDHRVSLHAPHSNRIE